MVITIMFNKLINRFYFVNRPIHQQTPERDKVLWLCSSAAPAAWFHSHAIQKNVEKFVTIT